MDSIIAGRFIGQDALAAEGVAGPVMNLVILAISGLCIGAGVLMSEAFGAKRTARLKETLATTLLFGAALCCAAAALGCALTPWILRALAVPDSIFGITGIYLRITFLGAPFTFFYNALAAGLKSVGDSKTPLKFLAFSAVLNAVLDLIFNWRAGLWHCVQRRDHCRGRGCQRAAGRRLHGTPRAGALPRAGGSGASAATCWGRFCVTAR